MALRDKALEGVARALLLWNEWNVHGFVLLSLFLQSFLFFGAPLRKKSKFVVLVVSIWSAYQLVDTAIFRAVALIVTQQNRTFVDLHELWMAFMILHFGGPDTITALAMEDNNLWVRAYIDIVLLLYITLHAVVSVPLEIREVGTVVLPFVSISSFLILFAGIVKSIGRVLSLSRASFDNFGRSLVQTAPNLGGDYAAIVEELELHEKAMVPAKPDYPQLAAASSTAQLYINKVGGPINKLTDARVITEAYYLFKKFRGTYVDTVYCCHDRKESRELFLSLLPDDGIKVAEKEMKFAYEAFYTKMHTFSLNPSILWLPFSLEIIALLLWSLKSKIGLRPLDITVTWILLFGTVSIDAASIVRFYCSDWMMARPGNALLQQFPPLANLLLFLRRRRWGKSKGSGWNGTPRSLCKLLNSWKHYMSFITLHTMSGDWCESISQLNFINYCIDERSKTGDCFYGFLGAKDMMDGGRYLTSVVLTDDLRMFIFDGIKMRSLLAQQLDCWEEASSSRGSWFLLHNLGKHPDPAAFEPWILDVEYDESLLIWHIATELCYQDEKQPDNDIERGHRRFSKTLSDYMLYLFLRQPKLMTEIAPLAEVIFKDTTEEARQFFHEEMSFSCLPSALKFKKTTDRVQKEACARIMQVLPDLPAAEYPRPNYIKEEENNSVLFDSCELAKRLMREEDIGTSRWEFISQMWVELLCYTAGHTSGNDHAKQLATGGELLTLVRLLMLHFGLSNQFRNRRG